jgi:TPR repeat protein
VVFACSDQGHGLSATSIARIIERGDPAQALRWHRKGAELGDLASMLSYAAALRSGTWIDRDEREAFAWYAKAAAQHGQGPFGYRRVAYAYLPIAEMYEAGAGVPRDLARAHAFAHAAEHALDDSDTVGRAKARDLQARIAARLHPRDMHAAEQVFESLRPAPAQRSSGGSTLSFLSIVLALAGLAWLAQRRWRASRPCLQSCA